MSGLAPPRVGLNHTAAAVSLPTDCLRRHDCCRSSQHAVVYLCQSVTRSPASVRRNDGASEVAVVEAVRCSC